MSGLFGYDDNLMKEFNVMNDPMGKDLAGELKAVVSLHAQAERDEAKADTAKEVAESSVEKASDGLTDFYEWAKSSDVHGTFTVFGTHVVLIREDGSVTIDAIRGVVGV